jgi:hypothetical protein
MALATMADSRRILTVRSGVVRCCTLLMPLLLLLFRPGLPECLTAILPGAHNKTVTVWQQPRIGPQLSSIRSQAHPTKGWSASPKGGFASGRTTGGGNDGGVVAASPRTKVVRGWPLTPCTGARKRGRDPSVVYRLTILSKQDHCASRVKNRGLHDRRYIGPL